MYEYVVLRRITCNTSRRYAPIAGRIFLIQSKHKEHLEVVMQVMIVHTDHRLLGMMTYVWQYCEA